MGRDLGLLMLICEAEKLDAAKTERLEQIDSELRKVELEIGNLTDFIAQGRSSEAVSAWLNACDDRKQRLEYEVMELKRRLSQQLEIPDFIELRARARAACEQLAVD